MHGGSQATADFKMDNNVIAAPQISPKMPAPQTGVFHDNHLQQ